MSYTTLVGAKALTGSIRSWINYEKIDPDGVLEDAQSYIYGALRCREMKTSAALTLAQGASSLALPAGYLDPLDLTLRSASELDLVQTTEKNLKRMRLTDGDDLAEGTPSWYAVWDEAFQFDCASEQADTVDVVYFATPDLLSSTNDENFLTRRYSAVLRSACLMQAAAMMSDDAIYMREQRRTDALLSRALIEADYALRGIR